MKYKFTYLGRGESADCYSGYNSTGYDEDGCFVEYDGKVVEADSEELAWQKFLNYKGCFGYPNEWDYEIEEEE